MARQWIKYELKKDPLKATIVFIEKLIREKKQTVISSLIGFVVVIVFAGIIYFAHKKNVEAAYASLIRAENILYSDPNLAITLADSVISNLKSDNELTALASYIKADALFIKKDYKSALKFYKNALKKINPAFKPNVIYSLAKTYEALGKIDEAQKKYQEFLGDSDRHYLAEDVYLSLARIFIKRGFYKEAKNYIEIVKSRSQGTKWEEYAKELASLIPGK